MKKVLKVLAFLPICVLLWWLAVYVATGFNALVPQQWLVLAFLSLGGSILGCLMVGGWPSERGSRDA